MPKFVIEREIPGAGKLSARDLQAVAQKSNRTIKQLGNKVQWQQSYVTGDKIYCVYIAEKEEDILEHAKVGGFPANRVSAIATIIDPTTGD